MSKYTKSAKELLKLLKGKENIAGVTHCITRLRFVLHDLHNIDTKAIDELEFVKGTFTNGGQFQVIIGNDVTEYYKEFIKISGVKELTKEDSKVAARDQMNFLERAISHLAEIFVPIIPAIVCGGLILGFRNLIGDVPMSNGLTLAEMYPWLAELHSFLWLPGEAIFAFLPVSVTWSTVKKLGGSEVLGIVLGITLVSPLLLNMYGYATADPSQIEVWKFGLLKIQKVGYQAQVLPALLAGIVLVFIEKQMNKITPNAIKMIVVPFITLMVTIILAFTIIGPIARVIGNNIAYSFNWLLSGPFKIVGALIFGVFYAPLVITGLHHTFVAVDTQLIATFGYTTIWPMIALSNIAQGASAFAIYLKTRKKDESVSSVASASTVSAWMGVTEPALYGINLKYKYPFYAALIGSGIAATISTMFSVKASGIGVGGLPGILSILPQSMLTFAIAMLFAIIVPIIFTFIFSKTSLNKNK